MSMSISSIDRRRKANLPTKPLPHGPRFPKIAQGRDIILQKLNLRSVVDLPQAECEDIKRYEISTPVAMAPTAQPHQNKPAQSQTLRAPIERAGIPQQTMHANQRSAPDTNAPPEPSNNSNQAPQRPMGNWKPPGIVAEEKREPGPKNKISAAAGQDNRLNALGEERRLKPRGEQQPIETGAVGAPSSEVKGNNSSAQHSPAFARKIGRPGEKGTSTWRAPEGW